MNTAVSSALYLVALVGALWSSGRPGPDRAGGRRRAVGTVVALAVVAVPSIVQLTVAPGLLGDWQRDRSMIGRGQLWRLVTALVVQDGGWVGTVFNLAFLVVVGTAAERLWGTRRWLAVALSAGIGAQLWGLLVQPVGAGNSVVNFGLAASMAVVALRRTRASVQGRFALVAAGASLLAALVLLVTGDLHGGAAAIGAVAGALLEPPAPAGGVEAVAQVEKP